MEYHIHEFHGQVSVRNGQLKRVKRSGWWLAGITDTESVAELSFRTTMLGYILPLLEGANPLKTAVMCLFHDTNEPGCYQS